MFFQSLIGSIPAYPLSCPSLHSITIHRPSTVSARSTTRKENLGGQGPTEDKKDNPATRLYVLCQALTPIGLFLSSLDPNWSFSSVWITVRWMITALIIGNGIIMGLETSQTIKQKFCAHICLRESKYLQKTVWQTQLE